MAAERSGRLLLRECLRMSRKFQPAQVLDESTRFEDVTWATHLRVETVTGVTSNSSTSGMSIQLALIKYKIRQVVKACHVKSSGPQVQRLDWWLGFSGCWFETTETFVDWSRQMLASQEFLENIIRKYMTAQPDFMWPQELSLASTRRLSLDASFKIKP